MNYIKELNAFYDQIDFNPLSGSAIAVWHALMHLNNKCGWQTTFSVPAGLIELKSGVKGSTFKRARNELREKGYIHMTPGSGSQAATYRMISQIRTFPEYTSATYQHADDAPSMSITVDEPSDKTHIPAQPDKPNSNQQTNTEPANQQLVSYNPIHPASAADQTAATLADQTSAQSQPGQTPGHTNDQTPAHNLNHNVDHNMDHNTTHNTGPLTKLDINKTETRQNTTTTTTTAPHFYQQHFGTPSPYILNDIQHWITAMSDPLVLDAMKRALEQNKPTWRYTKGILKSWQRKGITSVEEAKTDDQKFGERYGQKADTRSAAKSEVVPEWFKEREKKQKPKQGQRTNNQASPGLSQAEWEETKWLLAKHSRQKRAVGV